MTRAQKLIVFSEDNIYHSHTKFHKNLTGTLWAILRNRRPTDWQTYRPNTESHITKLSGQLFISVNMMHVNRLQSL